MGRRGRERKEIPIPTNGITENDKNITKNEFVKKKRKILQKYCDTLH